MNIVRLHLQDSEDTRESRARVFAYSSCVYPGQVPSGVHQRTISHLSTSQRMQLTDYYPNPIKHGNVSDLMAGESTDHLSLD